MSKKHIISFILLTIPLFAGAYDCQVDGIYYNLKSGNNAEVTSGDTKYSGAVSIPQKFTYNNVEYSVTTIGNSAFSNCSGLTSINIPNSVNSIGDSAFFNCSGLTSINIPNSVTSIGRDTFSACSGLTSIKVESGNTKYDSRNNCNAIIETNTNTLIAGCNNTIIPNSVTTIGNWAFSNCSGLTSINIPNSVTTIGNYAFNNCTSLTSINIPNSVNSIETSAFFNCSGLTSIKVESGNRKYDSRNNCNAIIKTNTNTLIAGCNNTIIPNSVTTIGNWAFFNCSGLTSINIPNSVNSIGDYVFDNCTSLTSINIPNSVNSIGDYVFDNCTSLTSINIPNSVNSIGNSAFFNCSGLTSINIPNSVNSIGNNVFDNCTSLTSINIPNSVNSIGNSAFFNCSGLTSINIPNSVTTIGNYAFYKCTSLTSITIPNSVTTIGNRAFNGCRGLASVISEIKDPQQVSLGTNVFFNTDAILYVPAGTKSSYEAISGWKDSFSEIFEVGGGIAVDETNFPDDAFRSWVLNNIPGASDGVLTNAEIGNVRSIDCSGTYDSRGNIHDMKGIECFTNLRELYCQYNQLTTLDVTKNTALEQLYCYNNQLTTLDVTKNTALNYLRCNNNQLTTLDVTNNTALRVLYCNNNQLTTLDVTKNTALEVLYCYNNQLTTLDVTKNTALNYLDCNNNQLTTLDVIKNTALELLACNNNQLTTLDVTNNTALRELYCYNNQLTTLDVTNNTALRELRCNNNQLTTLDVTKNTALNYLDCNNNQLTTLDVIKNTALEQLYCYNNQLTTLDVTNNTALRVLYCQNNKLLNLNLYYNTSISSSSRRLSNQKLSLTAVDIDAGIAIPVPSDFNYSKVSNMRLAGVSVTGKTTTVNSQKYLVFAATGTAQSSINGKILSYEYDTDNSAAGKMAVDVTLSYTAPGNPVTITANSYTITYGDPLPTFGYTTTGSALVGTPIITCSATSNSNAGTYDIIVSEGSVSNSSITLVKGTLTIKKATLRASVGSYTKKQGDAMPSFSISYLGFKNGETKSVLTREPTASCSATASSAPGSYPITLSGGQATNYEFNYQNGTLTVIAADAAAVTARSYTITYGDPLPQFAYETSGAALKGTPAISCAATSNSDAGTYDIVVSKGSVSNYNVSYVNGTLTIEKAVLTASVGEYTKKPGEDNPKFTISYSGFKKNQTKSVLDSEPTAKCDATKDSPSGTYPITLSGGSAKNYEFKYQDGVLKVLYSYPLSIISIGKGTTSFEGQTASQNKPINTTVYSGEQYIVTFKPDQGYKLGNLQWNGKDVIAEVTNNTYKISNVSQTSTLIAMYEESLGEFTAGGITYEILSGSESTVAVTKGNYTGQIEIPATVTDNGIKWSVVGIQNFAFSNTTILTVVIPESVKESNMGGGIFSECQNLAAITWNANFAVTGNMLSGLSNPNLLIYTKNAAYAPSSVKNVVVNGTAEEITLTDAQGSNNFYCPTEFTAREISYTHNYTMTSGFGGKAQGWETIALPFDVKEISHASKGTVLPFAAWNNSTSAKPFWLYSLSSGGFSKASSIQANTPYIICMPNNEEYDADYILSGAVTFKATNAKVKVSSAISSGKSGTKTFIPAFCAQEKSNKVYALNVNNDFHSERGGYDEGSRFVSNLRTVSPFEAYMTDSSAGAKLTIDIEFSDATGIDELTGDSGRLNTVYTLSGQLVVRTYSEQEMLKALEQQPEGVYIVNGKKKYIK